MDLPSVYADAQNRVIDLVSPLAAPALAAPVPGTPLWTVEQLVAHVTGVCADMVDGRVEGAGGDAWAARQVQQRQGRPLPDVLAEWRGRTPALIELLSTPGKVDACAFDIVTHEHDIRGAMGVAGPSDPAAVVGVTARVTRRVDGLIDKAGLPGLRLVHDDGEWVCGSAPVAVTGEAPTMEWFRALFGRRSPAQILTYGWDGDPSPYFGLLNLFGPLPAAVVAEAGAPVPPA